MPRARARIACLRRRSSCVTIDASMHVTTANATIVVALTSSVVLILREERKLFPGLALLAAGVEAVMAFGIMQISLKGFSLALALAVLLAIGGAVAWARAREKISVRPRRSSRSWARCSSR